MSVGMLIFLGVVLAPIVYLISLYNGLVRRRNGYRNAYRQIDVQLRRRYDLIPNLVETARGYLQHERATLEAVIQARNAASAAGAKAAAAPGDAAAMQGLASAEAGLTGVLSRFFALAEAYPDLKADQTMAQLSEELSSTENRIAYSRQAYNDAVMGYNNAAESFPGNVVAGTFGFRLAELLESVEAPEQRQAVKVSFQQP